MEEERSLEAYRKLVVEECNRKGIDQSVYEQWMEADVAEAFVWKVPVRLFVEKSIEALTAKLVKRHSSTFKTEGHK